jgi:hypothetical protein
VRFLAPEHNVAVIPLCYLQENIIRVCAVSAAGCKRAGFGDSHQHVVGPGPQRTADLSRIGHEGDEFRAIEQKFDLEVDVWILLLPFRQLFLEALELCGEGDVVPDRKVDDAEILSGEKEGGVRPRSA